MAYDFQVTIDCAHPHSLADWWADALEWEVEPSNPDFIRRMISEGQATDAETTTHKGVLVWLVGAAIRHPDQALGRRILFQLVPEPKTVKNRLHFDVRMGPEKVETELTRLTAAGATFLHRGQQGPHHWVSLADPEGNEFCIT